MPPKKETKTVSKMERLSDKMKREDMLPWIKTDNFVINEFLGGGIPLGRIIELYGIESTGKTAFGLWLMGQIQKNGGYFGYYDIEKAISMDRASEFIDAENCDYCDEITVEEVFPQINKFITDNKNKKPLGVFLDSIANLITDTEIETTENQIGYGGAKRALAIASGLKKLQYYISKHKVSCVFVNQLINTMAMYGDKETTPGGKALKHNCNIRLAFTTKLSNRIKEKGKSVGILMELFMKKNKLAARFDQTMVVPLYVDNRVISNKETVLANLIFFKIITPPPKKKNKNIFEQEEDNDELETIYGIEYDNSDSDYEENDSASKFDLDKDEIDDIGSSSKSKTDKGSKYKYKDKNISFEFTKSEYDKNIFDKYKDLFYERLKSKF